MIATVLAVVACAAPIRLDAPFRNLDFDAACRAASAESKVVLIDFFTTWCGPCKQLDATTWKDERVVRWLEEHTVALKLDAEVETELAKRYAVTAYPTLLFAAPDGTERGRILGYRSADAFLEQAADVLSGVRASERVRAKLAVAPEDVDLRQELAEALAQEGRLEEALAEYLWLYDEGMRKASGYGGVRNSFLLSDIVELGARYPQALDALRERAEAARSRMFDGEPRFDDAMDFASIKENMGKSVEVLALWDELTALDKLAPVRSALFDEVLDPLLEARRWSDVVGGVGDPLAYFARGVEIAGSVPPSEDDEYTEYTDATAFLRRSAVEDAAKIWKALLAVSDERAAVLEDRIVAFEPTEDTFAALFEGALEVDRKSELERLRARALAALDEEGRKDFERSAKRLERRAQRAAERAGEISRRKEQ